MQGMLMALGGAALLGLNVILWTWAAGMVREFRREARAPHLADEVARLTAEGLEKDKVIREQNADLDRLTAEAATLRARIQQCGIGR